MANRKVSLITTTYNESASIEQFIDSIEKQTLAPSEVIIVDAGSPDKTVSIIQKYLTQEKTRKSKYKTFIKKGVSRSEGRNIAISKAKNKLIAVTDAGCLLDENWLKELIKPFNNKKTDAVAGFYLPQYDNSFQEALSVFVCSPITNVVHGFLPSSRSVAFKKSVWLKVHGYPDDLNYCEDLVFDQKVVKAGYNFVPAPKSVVYWPQRRNIAQAFWQFYRYAYGDGQIFFSELQTHSLKIFLLYLRYLFFILCILILSVDPRLLPTVFIVYLVYLCVPIFVYRKRIKSVKAVLWIPILKLIADIAVITGSFKGMLAGRSIK